MSEFTREEIILKIEKGESLEGLDLSDIDLSTINMTKINLCGAKLYWANLRGAFLIRANLGRANLSKADLSFAFLLWANLGSARLSSANLSNANLSNANLRDTTLVSADLENASLEEADISGANIYHLKTNGWKIKDIKCTHIYQCDWEAWNNPEEREKYRRDFKPGEFEALHKVLPTMEMIFRKGFTYQDLNFLTMIIEQINPHLSSPLTMSEMKQGIATIVKVTAESNDILKTAIPMIQKMYKQLGEKEQEIKQLTYDKAILQGQIMGITQSKNDFKEILKEKIHQPDFLINGLNVDNPNMLNIGETYIDKRAYFFSTPEQAEKTAQEVIDHLLSSEDIEKTLTELDQTVSPQLKDPKKKNWFIKALKKHKSSLALIAETLTTIATGAGGSILAKILIGL